MVDERVTGFDEGFTGYDRPMTRRQPSSMHRQRGTQGWSNPIDRDTLDITRPIFRVVIGALLFAYSSMATIFMVCNIIDNMGITLSSEYKYGIGFLVAGIFTAGQWYYSEDKIIYLCFLIPDIALTYLWSRVYIYNGAEAFDVHEFFAFVFSAVIAFVSAYLPERIVLGPRRR